MIDLEKITDAPRHDIAYAGVALLSRYGNRHELEAVMGAVDWILDRAPDTAALIIENLCDSKACAAQTAKCCHLDGLCSPDEVRIVADMRPRLSRCGWGAQRNRRRSGRRCPAR
jgi:hypothetical protein